MKLLFMTDCYPPPLEGGSVVFLHNLISHLPPEDVLVITNARPGHDQFDRTQTYRTWRSGTEWRDFRKLGKLCVLAEWFFRFVPRLTNEHVDLVHVGDLFHSGMVAWVLKKFRGVPYVVYVYAEELTCQLQDHRMFFGRLRGYIYRQVLGDSDGIIGVSDFTLSLLPSFGVDPAKATKIVPMVIPFATVPEHEVDSLRRRYELNPGDRVVLTIGRLIERKGQDNLIRAFVQVLAAVPEARLVVAGRGKEASKLRTLAAKLGLGDSVVFAGFVPDEELPALFELCELFAMPHRELPNGDTEGCPTVFLEANAHGKPVVGGRVGGVRDAIIDGETGFLVGGEDPSQIATAIIRLLGDRDLASRLGEKGRRRVREELTPVKGAEKLLAYSRSILDKRSAI